MLPIKNILFFTYTTDHCLVFYSKLFDSGNTMCVSMDFIVLGTFFFDKFLCLYYNSSSLVSMFLYLFLTFIMAFLPDLSHMQEKRKLLCGLNPPYVLVEDRPWDLSGNPRLTSTDTDHIPLGNCFTLIYFFFQSNVLGFFYVIQVVSRVL